MADDVYEKIIYNYVISTMPVGGVTAFMALAIYKQNRDRVRVLSLCDCRLMS